MDITTLLQNILSPKTSNKPAKIATPSENAIAELLKGGAALNGSAMSPDKEPDADTVPEAQEAQPVAQPIVNPDAKDLLTNGTIPQDEQKGAVQLPPTNPVAMPVQNVALPPAQALMQQANAPQTIDSTTPAESNGQIQAQPAAQMQFPSQTIESTTPAQPSGQQVEQRPLDLPVTPAAPPDFQLFKTPEGKILRIGNNTAPDPGNEETYLKGKMADAQSHRPTNKLADIASVLLQSASNSINHTNNPVMTLDQIRQQRDQQKYLPRLQQIQADNQQAAQQNALKVKQDQEAEKLANDKALKEAQAAKALADARKQDADIEHLRQADADAGNKWEKLSQNNLLWKHNLKTGAIEPLVDPATNKQMVDKTLVTATDPITNESLQVEPNQKLTNSTNLAVGNAQRAQQVDIKNVDNQLDADKTNRSNRMKVDAANSTAMTNWYKDNLSKAMAGLSAINAAAGASDEMQGLSSQAQGLADRAADISDRFAAADDNPQEQEKIQKEMNAVQKEMGQLQAKFGTAVGKFDKTGALTQQINKMQLPKPKMMTYPKDITVQKVQGRTVGGKYQNQVFPDVRTLRSAFPGKKDADIKSIVEAQGGRFQN